MTSPRNALLFAVDQCRHILGPSVMDLRPTSVQIITRAWDDPGRSINSTSADTVTLSLPNYTKVRHVSQREVAQSGGLYELGDLIVGPITPQFVSPIDGTTGGFTEAQLAPVVTDPATEILYRVTQQSGATGINGDYARKDFKRDKTLRFMIVIGRKFTTPGP